MASQATVKGTKCWKDLSISENEHVVAVQGFYEGMFLTSRVKDTQNYVREVVAEIGDG